MNPEEKRKKILPIAGGSLLAVLLVVAIAG